MSFCDGALFSKEIILYYAPVNKGIAEMVTLWLEFKILRVGFVETMIQDVENIFVAWMRQKNQLIDTINL